MTPYSSLCDDFGIYSYINTKMELPTNRETVLHFFNSLQKQFPTMTDFDCRGANEYVLEEDREQGSYRWIGLEPKRFASGYVNPPSVEIADAQHERVLECAVSPGFRVARLRALDVLFSFDFNYSGNHDEVVAEDLAQHDA